MNCTAAPVSYIEIASPVKIQAELELPVGTQTPELDTWEKPENAFIVKDEEVKVERVLNDEQQAQLDEERRLEELRRAAGGDNWRDRGLKDMMDGVIEVKKDRILDILLFILYVKYNMSAFLTK